MILTFDRPDFLGECLASVERQTLTGFRLVILDNASPADYSGVLDRFRALPMEYVRNEANIGAAGNFEKAIRLYSDSQYLIVFHDDDMMHPRMLEWLLDVLERDPEIQFASTEYAAFDDGEAPARDSWDNVNLEIEVYDDQGDLARSLLGGGRLCFGSTMYRSSALTRIAGEPRFGILGDRPFLLEATRLGKSALIRAPLVRYRLHPGQDTNAGRVTAKNLIELMRAYRAALPAHWSPADRRLFYGHSSYFLLEYGYARLAPDDRIGAMGFLRSCIRSKVLRFRDIRPRYMATLLRVDGMRTLPAAIDAARAAKRRFLPRQQSAARDQPSSPDTREQAQHPHE